MFDLKINRTKKLQIKNNCALLENGKVVCWGSGSQGVLGYGIGDEDPDSLGYVKILAE